MFLITNGLRHKIPSGQTPNPLYALGLDSVAPVTVNSQWLSLFEPGSDLTFLKLEAPVDLSPGCRVAGFGDHRKRHRGQERRLHQTVRRHRRQEGHPADEPHRQALQDGNPAQCHAR